MNPFKKLLVLATAWSLVGCQTDNPGLTGPPPPAPPPQPKVDYQVIEATRDGLVIEYDTRVDILFVIDDSRSMRNHQANLSRNIHRFVESISKIKAIDFHIGYTLAHDSARYGSIVPAVCGAGTSTPGRVNWEDAGSLRPLIGPADKLPKDGRRFVTKNDDFVTILKESLDPNKNTALVKDLVDPDTSKPDLCPYGPEEEELFTPLLGAVDNPVVAQQANKGFRREGAMFIAVLVSDAKDASGLSEAQVYQRLERAITTKNGKRRFRIFAVGLKPDSEIGADTEGFRNRTCVPDPTWAERTGRDDKGNIQYRWPSRKRIGAEENPLAVLAKLTEGARGGSDQVLSICSADYGDDLAKFGTKITQDTLSDVTLQLPYHWQVTDNPEKKLRVFIGNTELVKDQHWVENPMDPSVTVFGQKIDWNKYPNEKIRVSFTPVKKGQTTSRPLRRTGG